MAKYNRKTVGSICKSKPAEDGTVKADYIRIRGDMKQVLIKALMNMDETKGLYLNLESKSSQLASLENAIAADKIGGEHAEKARERLNKIPDYVRFEIILLEKSE